MQDAPGAAVPRTVTDPAERGNSTPEPGSRILTDAATGATFAVPDAASLVAVVVVVVEFVVVVVVVVVAGCSSGRRGLGYGAKALACSFCCSSYRFIMHDAPVSGARVGFAAGFLVLALAVDAFGAPAVGIGFAREFLVGRDRCRLGRRRTGGDADRLAFADRNRLALCCHVHKAIVDGGAGGVVGRVLHVEIRSRIPATAVGVVTWNLEFGFAIFSAFALILPVNRLTLSSLFSIADRYRCF